MLAFEYIVKLIGKLVDKFKEPLTFGEFYGIFDEKYTNLDLYTGQIGYPSSGLKVDVDNLMFNPNILSILLKWDYNAIKNRFYSTYGKELVEFLYHPKNHEKWGKDYWDIEV